MVFLVFSWAGESFTREIFLPYVKFSLAPLFLYNSSKFLFNLSAIIFSHEKN